jgi:indole-3-glycerol phosphate synthase
MIRFTAPKGNIDKLAENSYRAIDDGAYEYEGAARSHTPLSLRKAILSSKHAALITEVKYSSPSQGKITSGSSTPSQIATEMVQGGACSLSVLTQPYLFEGSIRNLSEVRKTVSVPIIMKDIVVSRVQIDTAKRLGADCILLIKSIFDRDLAEESFESFAQYAGKFGLQVLAEAHTGIEYSDLLRQGQSIVGINNRNLDDLTIDPQNFKRLVELYGKGKSIVIAESGISQISDIVQLHECGADAFLVGTSIMASGDIKAKVAELRNAI